MMLALFGEGSFIKKNSWSHNLWSNKNNYSIKFTAFLFRLIISRVFPSQFNKHNEVIPHSFIV